MTDVRAKDSTKNLVAFYVETVNATYEQRMAALSNLARAVKSLEDHR